MLSPLRPLEGVNGWPTFLAFLEVEASLSYMLEERPPQASGAMALLVRLCRGPSPARPANSRWIQEWHVIDTVQISCAREGGRSKGHLQRSAGAA